MRIVKIKGGLGNQIFQYAFAKYLQKVTGDEIKLDNSYFETTLNDRIRQYHLNNFNCDIEIATKKEVNEILFFRNKDWFGSKSFLYKFFSFFEGLINKKYFKERKKKKISIKNLTEYNYFDGYFQDYFFVSRVPNELRDFFSELRESYRYQSSHFLEVSKVNSVFLAIRRGDYVESRNAKTTYGTLTFDYFEKAIRIILKMIQNPVFYVFSDDPGWVISNFDFKSLEIVYKVISSTGYSDIDEFFLMSFCKNGIMSNSTFHYWAAYMIDNREKIIIAPQPWKMNEDSNIIPDLWVKLDRFER